MGTVRILLVALIAAASGCASPYAAEYAKHGICAPTCRLWAWEEVPYRYDARHGQCVCYSPLAFEERGNYYVGDSRRDVMVRLPAPRRLRATDTEEDSRDKTTVIVEWVGLSSSNTPVLTP